MSGNETPETRLALLEDAFRRMSVTLTSIEGILTNISQQLADKAVDSARVRTEVFGRLGHIEAEQRVQNDHLTAIDKELSDINKKMEDHITIDRWTRRIVFGGFGFAAAAFAWAWDHITFGVK